MMRKFLLAVMAAAALPGPALAKCYDFGVWSKETYCFPDAEEAPVDIVVDPQSLDLPFREAVQAFAELTGTASAYLALPAPSGEDELNQRVSDFFVAAHGENDYLVQGVERLEMIIGGMHRHIAETTSYIEANASTAAILTAERDRLQAELADMAVLRDKWQARVATLRGAANDLSLNAKYARQSVIDLLAAAAPKENLLISSTMIDNAESVWRQFPDPPPMVSELAAAGPAADSVAPDWRPEERPLNIDLAAPRDAKVQSLWQLADVMRSNSARLDQLAAERAAILPEVVAVNDRKESLDSELYPLQSQVASLRADAEKAVDETAQAKGDSLDARDKMVLSAVQEWLWNAARDNVIVPEVAAFLAANGHDQVAGKLGVSGILETIEDVRGITWSDALGIRGLDEFMAVQEKTVNLLNPAQSLILQSAEINAWATPAAGEAFARGVFERLGDDAAEFFRAAGQVNVDEHYQGLVRSLLGDMGPRKAAEEL